MNKQKAIATIEATLPTKKAVALQTAIASLASSRVEEILNERMAEIRAAHRRQFLASLDLALRDRKRRQLPSKR
jgi:hypothetical protein